MFYVIPKGISKLNNCVFLDSEFNFAVFVESFNFFPAAAASEFLDDEKQKQTQISKLYVNLNRVASSFQ